MNAHRVEATVNQDGTLTLKDLPFHPGDAVEVIILERAPQVKARDRYPLRGQPVHYDDPTEPVAQEDWEAVR